MSSKSPLDESVKLPKAVRDAAARASEIHNASYSKQPAEPAPAEPPKEPEPKPVEAAPAEPPTESPAAPAPAPAEPAPAPAEPPKETTNWERAFKSMKGRHQRAEQTIGEMRAQMNEMRAAMEAMQRSQTRQPEPTLELPEKLITEKDLEDYGPDLIKVMGNKAKEELHPYVTKIAQLQRKIDQLEGKVAGTEQQVHVTARQRMLTELDGLVPNWRELDTDQRFLEWLALPDRYSRAIRHELLKAAYEHNDAPTVAAFFQGFLAEEAATDPAKAGEIQPPAPLAPPAPKVSLDSLAAPGRAKSTAAPAPVEKPTISRAQISRFYADVNRGAYSAEEKQRYERMIFEAQAEGRIIN